jgi:hypothetical protein
MRSQRAFSQLELQLGPGPLCGNCPLVIACGASERPEACQPGWGDPASGGVNVLHPRNPDTWSYLEEINGARFDDVRVGDRSALPLPAFMHQIRPVRALRGWLADGAYTVGPWKTIDQRAVMSCSEFREIVGIGPEQRVGLVLFGQDAILERMWERRLLLAPQIARANYDFCVAPSFSNYLGRPRPEYLYNAKRSLHFFDLLQTHGVTAIPRVAWLIDPDVARFAAWVEANPKLKLVALDLSSSSPSHWRREIEHLRTFDVMTQHRLSYFVHGPSRKGRFLDLYRLLDPERLHLSNSRAIAARPARADMNYGERLATEQALVAAATRAA